MINRRKFVQGSVLAPLLPASSMHVKAATHENKSDSIGWKNWSGGQTSQPDARLAPANEQAVIDLLSSSNKKVKTVGSGHSFSPLAATDDVLVSLSRLAGLIDSHAESQQSTFFAGTRIADMTAPLDNINQGLINIADIDKQTLAGAIATSTHGTGQTLGSYSSYVRGLRLITAKGEVIDCDEQNSPEIFRAACVSLGGLGIITRVNIQNREQYRLKKSVWGAPTEEILEQVDDLKANYRHFEMFPMVNADVCLAQTIEETSEPVSAQSLTEEEDDTLQLLQKYGRYAPSIRSWLINSIVGGMDRVEATGNSYNMLTNARNMRFNEMEYQVPADAGPACLREILATIKKKKLDIVFPLEYRYVAADNRWLSMFSGRDSCSISVHHFADYDYKAYFAEIEPIFWKYAGRPHWGKLHTLTAVQLKQLYPNWEDFLAVREALDPNKRFLNSHLASVFGV
jgi:FAD-linked oxidoreductase